MGVFDFLNDVPHSEVDVVVDNDGVYFYRDLESGDTERLGELDPIDLLYSLLEEKGFKSVEPA